MAALPPDVAVVPVEPEHYRAIYEAMKDAYRDIWTSTPETEEDYQEFLAENVTTSHYDPSLWQVAWAGEEVVGLVLSQVVGEVGQVEVRRAWQRRGVARSLLHRALMHLRERSLSEARLYTDAANGQGARSLYESVGFREVKQHIFYRKLLDSSGD
jgi:ribosomal protein S18 acetylase RimI-like enzyme